MNAEAIAISPHDLPRRTARSRARTLAAPDGRTASAKRARQLQTAIEAQLGAANDVTPAQQQLVRRAAVLGALAEDLEAKSLAGDAQGRAEYVTIVSEQRLALAALGIAGAAP